MPRMFSPTLLFFASQLLVCVLSQSPQDIAEVFQTTQIVPDVIPLFNPSVVLQVSFGAPITPGQSLTTNQTVSIPSFKVKGGTSNTNYVVLMVDPDAPSPPNRTLADIRHYLGGGYTVSGTADSNGFQTLITTLPPVTEYLGPSPPSGSPAHRYVLLLYLQPSTFFQQTAVTASTARTNFNVPNFQSAAGLGSPIGGNMFYVGPNSPASTTLSTTAPPATAAVPPASVTTTRDVSSGANVFTCTFTTVLIGSVAPFIWIWF